MEKRRKERGMTRDGEREIPEGEAREGWRRGGSEWKFGGQVPKIQIINSRVVVFLWKENSCTFKENLENTQK